jgi:hypothetical protein
VEVHPAPALRPEPGIEVALEGDDLGAKRGFLGVQARAGPRVTIGVGEDVGRLREHALGRHQHGDRAAAAGTPRGDAMDDLHVVLLAVRDAGPVQRPAGFLAVVADRDRDQPRGRCHG